MWGQTEETISGAFRVLAAAVVVGVVIVGTCLFFIGRCSARYDIRIEAKEAGR